MINVKQSMVNMVPSKVEVTLRKADQVAWGKLEDPNYKPEPEPIEDNMETTESYQPDWDIADDDISDSDEDWAYDTRDNKKKPWDEDGEEEQKKNEEEKQKKNEEEIQNLKRKEVEEEMKRAMEERKKAEEERKKLEEDRRQEEAGEFEDMPDLE